MRDYKNNYVVIIFVFVRKNLLSKSDVFSFHGHVKMRL